jgi:hypothetical protein
MFWDPVADGDDGVNVVSIPVPPAPTRIATQSDMRRFQSDGFVLAGAVRTAAVADAAADKPAAADGAAAAGAGAPMHVFAVRVVPDSGLMYVSTKAVSRLAGGSVGGGSGAGSGGSGSGGVKGAAQPQITAGRPGTGRTYPEQRPRAPTKGSSGTGSSTDDTSGDGGGAPKTPASSSPGVPPSAPFAAAAAYPGIDKRFWQQVTKLQPYPLTAVGYIRSMLSDSFSARCRWVGWAPCLLLCWGLSAAALPARNQQARRQ